MTSVMFAYLHKSMVSHSWMRSWYDCIKYEESRGTKVQPFAIRGNDGMVGLGRNQMAYQFKYTDNEYLFWTDPDIGFQEDSVQRLLEHKLPIVSGLYFSPKLFPDGYNGYKTWFYPQVYDLKGEMYVPREGYEKSSLIEVDGVGSGFVLIHRDVIDTLGTEPYSYLSTSKGGMISEDLAFCARAKSVGFKIYVDTSVKATHHKDSLWISEEDYR